jgi:tetratricopeptide (TPR) repeat protein
VVQPVGDHSREFAIGLTLAWFVLVALPILISAAIGQSFSGLPVIGLLIWLILLRVARGISPASRADTLLNKGRAAAALSICEQALAVSGDYAWIDTRRLVWLNRRTMALLALGRADEALTSALEALAITADPETVGNCALALLRLNRYDAAAQAAHLALALTNERSLVGHAVLAQVMLAWGRPAEAEALATAGLEDVRALLPYVRPEHYVLCLAAHSRALRRDADAGNGGPKRVLLAARALSDLRRAALKHPRLRAVASLESADELSGDPEAASQTSELIALALDADTPFVYWYITQPGTLAEQRDTERIAALDQAAQQRIIGMDATAPSPEEVTAALATAAQAGHPRPAPQASWLALAVQIVTLASTVALLVLWTWRFFLYGS